MRSINELRQDQAAVLASYRQETAGGETVAALPRPGGVTAVTVYAKVSAVISSDATYGPHLMVVRQKWTGTPPGMVDAGAPAERCYPSPNHAVDDYQQNQPVRLAVTHGAMIAEQLG